MNQSKQQDPAKAFLGIGWSFPIAPDLQVADVDMAQYEEDIRKAILLILETEPIKRLPHITISQ